MPAPSELFHIECFCEDQNLSKVLRRITGLVIESPKVTPVVNAEVGKTKNGTGKISQKTDGLAIDLLREHLRSLDVSNITMPEIRDFLASIGRSRKSGGTLTKRALEDGILRKAKGHNTGYIVVR